MAINAAQLMVRVGADTKPAERELNSFSQRLAGHAKRMGVAGTAMTVGITAPLLAASRAVYKIGTDFESAFAGVVKTVDATAPQLAALETGIRNMAKELPASAVEIANVAAAAGQLGISTDNILGFTRVMIDLGEATNLTADQAATELARFANITRMPQTEFERLGSTVVALGNNLATTEAEIVTMGMRLAGAGDQVGLAQSEIMGFAAALSSVGIEAEAGGTAFSRVMLDMNTAVRSGGKDLQLFARVAGVSAEVFAKTFEEDASAALIGFIEGLGRMGDEGANLAAVLEELGFGEIRVRDALLRASGAGDLFRRSVTLANEAWEENIALSKEAEQRYQTTASRVSVMMNRFRDLGITLFKAVAPSLDEVIERVSNFASELSDGVEEFVSANPQIVNMALALGAVLAVAGPLVGVLAAVAGAFALLGPLAAPVAVLTAAAAALAAVFATDFLGIGTAVSGAIADLQTLWAELQKPVGEITIGPLTATWTPEVKTIDIAGVITGELNLKERVATLQVGDIIDATATWQPTYKAIDINDGLITGTLDTKAHVAAFDIAGIVTGKLDTARHFATLKVGDIVDVTAELEPNYKSVDINDGLITGSLNMVNRVSSVAIDGIFSGTIDLSKRFAKVTFGDLLDISGQVGADGKIAVRFTGEDFDFDLSDVSAKLQGQIAFLKTALETQFAGFGNLTFPQKLSTIVNAAALAATALTSIPTGEVGRVGPVLTNLATAITSFAAAVLGGIDTGAIGRVLTNVATNVSTFTQKFLDPTALEGLGSAAGSLVSTLVAKITELLSGPGFAADLGGAFAGATAALIQGAAGFAMGLADQLAQTDWGKFSGSIGTFVTQFVAGFGEGIKAADASPVGRAITEKISSEIRKAVEGEPLLNWLFLGGPRPTFEQFMFGNDEQGAQRFRQGPLGRAFGLDSDEPRVNVMVDPIVDSSAVQGIGKALQSAGLSDEVGEVVAQGVQKGLTSNLTGAGGVNVGGAFVPMLTAGATPALGALANLIMDYFNREPVEVPVQPVISPEAASRRDALMSSLMNEELVIPVAPEIQREKWEQTLNANPFVVPFQPMLELDDLSILDAAKPKMPVEVIDFVVPDNVTPEVSKVIARDVEMPKSFDAWGGLTSILQDAAASATVQTEAPVFEWPALPEWVWPPLPVFTWPALPVWTWPAIPRPGWLSDMVVPRPSWLGELLAWSPVVTVRSAPATAGVGANAAGTNYWRGGLTWVGEKGAELIDLPRGTRIHNHEESMALAGAGGPNITIHATVHNKIDVEEIAYRVLKLLDRKGRR